MEVDRDITNATKDVSVQTYKDQMQTAWGIWRHYRSSISTDGCHGLPSRMKTNTLAATDPVRWRASEMAKSQSEGAQAWHQYRYAIGHHLRNHSQSSWDEAAANAVEAAAKLPHAADTQPRILTSMRRLYERNCVPTSVDYCLTKARDQIASPTGCSSWEETSS
jgi:hypothetical protein